MVTDNFASSVFGDPRNHLSMDEFFLGLLSRAGSQTEQQGTDGEMAYSLNYVRVAAETHWHVSVENVF